MLNKIKKILGLDPAVQTEEQLNIHVGLLNGKLCIKINKKVDVITFDKNQLYQLLADIASQASSLK